MGSSDHHLFNRTRTIHQILGAGLVADVILWRQKNLTIEILLLTLSVWVIFEKSGYTLLSLFSSVLLLLFAILFLWAKSAAIVNRPAPPIPELYLSEEMVNQAASFIRTRVNDLLSASHDIALGKDSRAFVKLAMFLGLIAFVGGLTDFLTLGYTSFVVVLTIPVLYERFEDSIDSCCLLGYYKMKKLYGDFDRNCVNRVRNWILEARKLS